MENVLKATDADSRFEFVFIKKNEVENEKII